MRLPRHFPRRIMAHGRSGWGSNWWSEDRWKANDWQAGSAESWQGDAGAWSQPARGAGDSSSSWRDKPSERKQQAESCSSSASTGQKAESCSSSASTGHKDKGPESRQSKPGARGAGAGNQRSIGRGRWRQGGDQDQADEASAGAAEAGVARLMEAQLGAAAQHVPTQQRHAQPKSQASRGPLAEPTSTRARVVPVQAAPATKAAPAKAAPAKTASPPTRTVAPTLSAGCLEEREVLEAIYGDDFSLQGESEWQVAISEGVTVTFAVPEGYPLSFEPPRCHLDIQAASVDAEALRQFVASLRSDWNPTEEQCISTWAQAIRDQLESSSPLPKPVGASVETEVS